MNLLVPKEGIGILGGPSRALDNSARSLDLIKRARRIARNHAVDLAVHEQIEGFQDDGPDQSGVAFGFDDSFERVVPAEQLSPAPIPLSINVVTEAHSA
jgi:hypothetical protein